jgi:hypothetical protein
MSGGDHNEQAGRGTDAVLRVYSRLAREEPPRAVDTAVLAAGREAVRPARPGVRRWWIPASVAATAVLALSVVLEVGRQDARDETRDLDRPVPTEGLPRGTAEQAPSLAPAADSALPAAPPPPPAAAGRSMESQSAGPSREAAPRAAAQRPGEYPEAMSSGPAADAVRAEPTPEAWLARIEALEQAGLEDEAARERAALEAAYPGWLERQESTPQ